MTHSESTSASDEVRATRFVVWFVLVLTGLRLAALMVTPLELYPDEAQYWLWSRTLDFGYFSKPPMIAWVIWATTQLGGDSEAFVRLSAPLFHAVATIALFAVGKRLYGPWTGLGAAIVYALMPGVQLSSGVISTDAPLLCFLALALLAYVALQGEDRRLRHAVGLGAALGLAMLSKYAALYALIGIGLHLALSAEARRAWDLKSAAAAIVAFLVVLAPNLIWNANHGFATVGHTAANANLGGKLFNPGEMLTFLGEQFGVFGPLPFAVLVGGGLFLAIRRKLQPQDLLLACWTLPPLLVVTVQAFLSRANANWAASAYVAGAVLVAALLLRWRAKWWIVGGVVVQVAIAALFLAWTANPQIADAMGRSNDIKRARGWEQISEAVIRRAEVEALNGGLTAIAVDDRFLFNTISYYGRDYLKRPDAAPLVIWLRQTHAGNQAEATAPLTVKDGRRVLAVALEDKATDRIIADFARAERIEIVSVLLSPKCRTKPNEKPERFDHRCRRRVALILGEDFRPVARD